MSVKTPYQLFIDNVNKYPNNIAVIDESLTLTYAELAKLVEQYASYLHDCDIGLQDRVLVILPRRYNLLIVMLAILSLGAIYVPIDEDLPNQRVEQLITNLQPKKIITRDDLNKSSNKSINFNNQLLEDSLCYIIHTSGSTGLPKGVMVKNIGLVNYSQWFQNYTHCRVGERIDFSSSHAFDMAITNTLVALLLGLTIVIATDVIKKNPRQYLEFIADNQLDYIKITPSYLQVLLYELNFTKVQLPHLKRLIVGGESLLTQDVRLWLKYFPNQIIHNEYGPTEVTVAVTQCEVNSQNIDNFKSTLIPIGIPGQNMQLRIVDHNLNRVKVGELLVGGLGVAEGYWQQQEATQAKFITIDSIRFYHTGDLVHQLDDGSLMYDGREDSQIKIRGYRVELAEIESFLTEHFPSLHKAIIFYKNQIVVCYEKNATINLDTVVNELKQHFPEYMLPSRWVALAAIPLNHNGKLDQKALQVILDTEHSENISFNTNTTNFAKQIAAIWSHELAEMNISESSNFFDLGGDSLKAARILTKIYNEHSLDVLVHELYQHPVLLDFIEFIAEKPKILNTLTTYHNINVPLSDFQWMLWMSHKFDRTIKRFNIAERFRFHDPLDHNSLESRLINIIEQQQIFYYKLNKFSPKQQITNKARYKLIGFDKLQLLTEDEASANFQKLLAFNKWSHYNILIYLLVIADGSYELQIVIPHIFSDAVSFDLFIKHHTPKSQFHEYIVFEQAKYQKNLTAKINYWQDYFSDTDLLHLPTDWKHNNDSFSSYKIISDETISGLKKYKKFKGLVLSDLIIAVIIQALSKMLPDHVPQTIIFNQVISTRHDHKFDNTMGCFLRLDPIKFNLKKNLSVDEIISQIQHQNQQTAHFQDTPALIKIAALPRFSKNNNLFLNFISKIYGKFTKLNILEQATLGAAMHLRPIKKTNAFFININISHNFYSYNSSEQNVLQKYYDWIKVNNCLDISLIRFNNQPHLVISANLNDTIKSQLAENIIKFIQNLQ